MLCLENIGSCGIHTEQKKTKNKNKKIKKQKFQIRQSIKVDVEIVSELSCSKRYMCQ